MDFCVKSINLVGAFQPISDIGFILILLILITFDNNTIDVLERELKTISGNVDELLSATASMLSKVSSMFGVITISEYHNSILADIDLVELNKNRAMIVLAMDNGLVKSIVLNLDIEIATKHIHSITEILKEKLRGLSLIEIQNTIFKRLNDTKAIDHEIVQILINDRLNTFLSKIIS